MYPPLASPTSPNDEEMADLNILNSAASVQEIQKPTKIITTNAMANGDLGDRPLSGEGQLPKATDTIRNNIDLKNETAKKRTSLHIENGIGNGVGNGAVVGAIDPDTINIDDIVTTPCIVSDRTKFHMKRNSRALDNAMHGDNNNRIDDSSSSGSSGGSSSSSSGDEKPIRNCSTLSDIDNRKVRRVRTRANNGNRNAADDDGDYHDMDNGNDTSDSGGKRDSVTSKDSSSDDYFLCEKFKNSLNAQFSEGVVQAADVNAAGEPMELLSPQEVEFGRRYAEIAQFKNNNNNKW